MTSKFVYITFENCVSEEETEMSFLTDETVIVTNHSGTPEEREFCTVKIGANNFTFADSFASSFINGGKSQEIFEFDENEETTENYDND